jgi:hypothetical protein
MSGSFPPLPELRPFQLPNIAGIANAMQEQSLNAMREQQLMGAEQERGNIRRLVSTPGFDISSPDAPNRLLAVAPTTGAAAYQALTAGLNQRRQAQNADVQRGIQLTQQYRDEMPGLTPDTYADFLARVQRDVPGWSRQLPPTFDRARLDVLMQKADQSLAEWEQIEIEGTPFLMNRRLGQIVPFTEGPARNAAPAAPGAAPMATPMSAPAAPGAAAGDMIPLSAPATGAAPVPTSRSTDISTILPAIDRGEGRGANPASSARGQFQFIGPTFIDEFKRNFPDIARGLSNSQILSYRNSTLPDGRPIEEFLGEAHTNRNAATLSRAGFEPNGANLYLAHFAGIGGARSLLSANPNAPVESVLSKDAIDANPFLKGKTVGQILQWAGDTVDYGPGAARRRLLAMGAPDNRVEPGAALTSPVLQTPLTNAMTATPVSNAFVKPSTGGGMKADAFLDDATLASSPLITPASDVRPTAPSLPRNIAEAREMRLQREEEQARARQRGQETAKSEKEREDNVRNIDSALDIINNVTKLDPRSGVSTLGRATGSGVGALRDWVASWGGWDTPGSEAAAKLETAQARLVALLPRMRGDLNKSEFDSLQAQAAKLGDRSLTNRSRAAALVELTQDLARIRERLSGQRGSAGGGAPAAPAPGTVQDGYRFKGGDPSNSQNWERE